MGLSFSDDEIADEMGLSANDGTSFLREKIVERKPWVVRPRHLRPATPQ